MIHWFYNGDYTPQATDSNAPTPLLQGFTESVEPLIAHLDIYVIADKYDVGLLKKLARLRFLDLLNAHQIHNDLAWIQECFPKAVGAVYRTTMASDTAVRDSLVSMIKGHWALLRNSMPFMDVLRSDGDLAVDILDDWTVDRVQLRRVSMFGRTSQFLHSCACCPDMRLPEKWGDGEHAICLACGGKIS